MVTRSSSATRFREGGLGVLPMGGGNGAGREGTMGGKGMGDRAVSLPSLFPNNARTALGPGYPGGASGERPPAPKRAPSELLLERREFGSVNSQAHKPKITAFLDLAQYSNYTNPVVPVDQPLFSVTPPVITFSDFEGLQTYEATVTLRNQDNVARRVKVYPPDSPFFELAAGRGRKAKPSSTGGGSSGGDKIAPGMEVTYTVRFRPDAKIDYSHDLVVITERERFTVPVRASGGSALLDFPDFVDFGSDCVVGHQSERTVLVRNVGDRPTKFLLRTSPPFTVVAPVDHLAEGATCQVQIHFTPEKAEAHECELHLKYGGMEAAAMLYGAAVNAEVSLSHSLLVIGDTYVGLDTQGVVTIRNDSDVPVDFSWRLFPSVAQERQYRAELQARLKLEERDETLYMQQAQNSEDSSDDSCSDEERLRARREAKVNSGLSRKYGNISKAVTEDPMLFRDATFAVTPLSGRIWAHSQLTCACTFCPRDALVYSCTAYLSCVGQEERAPLVLRGLGIGPKATFSYNELDVGHVFVESQHRYEVQLLNQGDIEVNFRLTPPRSTAFGSQFKFEPSQGTIEVGGQCEIVVDFKPGELGAFHEVFEWTLKGSATAVTLTFRGRSVEPTFEFDQDKLNFGTVSFGFLNSRMLTLTNTAEVPIIYQLRVPGDAIPPDQEFTLIPSKGMLLPNCAQRIQVDFVSLTEKTYDVNLVVDLEGISKELLSVPIKAQCSVPQVSFEPHGTLSYGDIFIRYPFHQSLYLHNTSTLPAKFEVLPQEDTSRAEFEPDQWVGTVPPCASHVITVTVTAHTRGPVRIPMYVKIHGRSVPFPLVLVANSIGPLVKVEPESVDWTTVSCLQPDIRHVRLTNNSRIDASVRAFMNERKSLWTVHPKTIHLSPQETLNLSLTLRIDECTTVNDTLNLVVNEGNDLAVAVRGKGVGTPIRCDQDLSLVDFEKIFTTHTESKDIVIRNYGQYSRRIQWVREKEKKGKDDPGGKKNQPVDPDKVPPPVFRVEPESVNIEPKSAYRFTLCAMSATPGIVEDSLICNETPEKGGSGAKPVFNFKPRFRANFIAPLLKISRPRVEFEFFWQRDKPVEPMTDSITLTNTGELEVGFKVQVTYPFSCDIDEGSIPPYGDLEIQVDFDPAFKADRKSGIKKEKLIIQYDDHPSSNVVELVGKVVWPNIELNETKLDFGHVLNDTTKKMELKMHNPTALTVAYTWYFSMQGRESEMVSNPKTPAGRTPGASLGGTTTGSFRPPGPTAPPSGMLATTTSGLTWAPSINSGSVDPMLQSGMPAAMSHASGFVGSTHSEWPQNQSDDIDLNQIFDILPIFGKIEPGETQVTTISYFAAKERMFKAVACCTVDGGPEYEVQLKGSAAECFTKLDKNELDFGEIPFTEVGEQEVYLSNPGKVPASFNFNLSGVSRPFVVDITPGSGVLQPEKSARCIVKFRAGIPDLVTEQVLVEVAHFEPSKLMVRGSGTFPGVVLDLVRKNEAEHRISMEKAAHRMGRALGVAEAVDAIDTASSAAGPADGSAVSGKSGKSGAEARPQSSISRAGTQHDLSATSDRPGTSGALDATARATFPEDWNRLEHLDLELEFEVDRHNLCAMLLKGATPPEKTDMMSTMKSTGGLRSTMSPQRTGGMKKKEPPPVTASSYICDFSYIALGQSKKMSFTMYNCCTEPVFVSIDKKLLKDHGFIVEPDTIKNLQPNKSLLMHVTATRQREEGEGVRELAWNLPVRGGPNYVVNLHASFVLPDLVLSSEAVDFGRVLVGQRKCVTLMIRNTKMVPVEWKFVQTTDKLGRKPPAHELVFDLSPSSGVLQPGDSRMIIASFSPPAQKMAMTHTSTLQLKLVDNPKRKVINVIGRSDTLHLQIENEYEKPGTSYELGPIMPKRDGCSKVFYLVNPTDLPIEVFCADFDQDYRQEEDMISSYFDAYSARLADAHFAANASAGTRYLNLLSASGMQSGQRIRINPGMPNEEDHIVTKAVPIGEGESALHDLQVIAEPLRYAHKAREPIALLAEMPVRLPGDPTWRAVHKITYDMHEKRREEKIARGDDEDTIEPAMEPPGDEEGPEEEDLVPNPIYYPFRVAPGKRHSAIIFGPSKIGQTTVAHRLAHDDGRKIIKIDDGLNWALRNPRVLRPDRIAKRIVEKTRRWSDGKGTPPTSDEMAHILKRRMELADCNAGVIIDGLSSEYMSSTQAVETAMKALKGEQISFMRLTVSEGSEAGSATGPNATAPSIDPDVDPSLVGTRLGQALSAHIENLKAPENRDHYLSELNSVLGALEAAYAEASDAVTTALNDAAEAETAAEGAAVQAAQAAAERAAEAEAEAAAIERGEDPPPNPAEEDIVVEDNTQAANAKLQSAKIALHKAQKALENCKAEIQRCEDLNTWEPPPAPRPDDEPPTPPPDPKAKKGSGPSPEEIAAKEAKKRVRDYDLFASKYQEASTGVDAAVADFLAKCREDEEDRQRELEKRRRAIAAKKREAKARARPGLAAKAKAEPKLSITESPEYIAAMEHFDQNPPIVINDFEVKVPPTMSKPEEPSSKEHGAELERTESQAEHTEHELSQPQSSLMLQLREALPLPIIPDGDQLPPPTIVHVLEQPPARPQPQPPANFKLLTPVPPKSRSPSKQAADEAARTAAIEAGAEPPQEPEEEYVENQNRWIIEPHEKQKLKVHFNSEEVQTYMETMTFELVDDATQTKVPITVSGISDLPGISQDTRLIFFNRRKKKRPADGYATKAFVTSKGIYDFGPLISGRKPKERFPEEPTADEAPGGDALVDGASATAGGVESGTDDEAAAPGALIDIPITPSAAMLSKEVMKHCETIRITNDSLFPAMVRLGLDSDPPPEDGVDYDPAEEIQKAKDSNGPFIVEPPTLDLAIGQSHDVKIWCFPPDDLEGLIEAKIIARIQHNDKYWSCGLTALGAVPRAKIEFDGDSQVVDFKRMMNTVPAPDEKVVLKNDTLLPVKWQFKCLKASIINPEGEKVAIVPSAYYKSWLKKDRPKDGEEVEDGQETEEPPPMVPEEFRVEAMEGTLAPGESRDIRIGFQAKQSATFNFTLGLEVRDTEGLNDWKEMGDFEVKAETFAVEVAVVPDPTDNILNFDTVLVNTTEPPEEKFDVVNRGRFPISYKLLVPRRGALQGLLSIVNAEDVLQPGESKQITVRCAPKRTLSLDASSMDGIELLVHDEASKVKFEHGIPAMKVAVRAVFNEFMVTPPRGVNFGPVKLGVAPAPTREFQIRNIGLFKFEWRLFDEGDPPTMGADEQKPPKLEDSIKVGPFTVTPTSGTLDRESEVTVQVTFDAKGDKEGNSKVSDRDYDHKIAIWVDGVQNEPIDLMSLSARGSGGFGSTPPVAHSIPGTSRYLLSGHSCVPGMNTTDLQSIFEEQFYARNLEDAIDIAGRPDVRCFCEADEIFSFGPVLAHGNSSGASIPASPMSGGGDKDAVDGVVEKFRFSNPKAIECTVDISVKPRDREQKEPLAFDVTPQVVRIPPHDSVQIECWFRPQEIKSYYAVLEAEVQGGTDDLTKYLSFELRGDGAVPSVSLQGPPLYGDDGGDLQLELGKLALGRSHEVRMALRNDGKLPAVARVDWKPSAHFTVNCPSNVPLKRGEQKPFQIRFHPKKAGNVQADLSIKTVGNQFEDVRIQLSGEGYSDEVAWDLTEIKRPSGPKAGVRTDEGHSEESKPPEPDVLELGEVPVGREVRTTFYLTNNKKESLRFQFPDAMPDIFGDQLKIEPMVGFVKPAARQPITITLLPTQKFDATQAPLASLPCNTVAVEIEEQEDKSPTFKDEADEEKEPKYTEIDDTQREVPLKISAAADEQLLECDIDAVNFAPTVMFCTKLYRFNLRNPSSISAPFEWRVQGKTASAFSVNPQVGSVPAGGEKDIEVRFSPVEVEDFNCTLACHLTGNAGTTATGGVTKPHLSLPLTGAALRPWCHIDLPACDYKSRRQSDTPLDPKYRCAEITNIGTGSKGTKRFYVSNPTAQPIDFIWTRDAASDMSRPENDDNDPFRCTTKRGTILPGKKYEMVFEFAPTTIDTKESFWSFLLVGPQVVEHFLIAGTVKEPRVGMNVPNINFGEYLLEGASTEKVTLVNKEDVPFKFEFDAASFQLEGQAPALTVAPMSGVLGPDGTQDIVVTFKPLEEKSFNFNVVCKVKRKKEPVVLNVKGIGYKIHASLMLEEPSGARTIYAGIPDLLDFGQLQVQEQRTMKMYLRNDSKRNINYRIFMLSGASRRPRHLEKPNKPPYLSLSNTEGVAKHHEDTPIELTYAPHDVHALDGSTLQVVIPAGPKDDVFSLQLSGGAKRSRVDFSFMRYNFGPCFIARGGATMAGEPFATSEDSRYETVELIATNRDDQDILISTNFQREPWLDVKLDATMIASGDVLRIPIVFSPREVCQYTTNIEFLVNDHTKTSVEIRGAGCPLRLELTDLEMQHVDFGVTTGGEPLTKMVRLVNRSQRPVTFELEDQGGELLERRVAWFPSQPTTLRPRETCDVDIRFTPEYRIPPFRLPLYAKCSHGINLRLLQVAGTCHAVEMRLSEHSVFFDDVIVGSQATRSMKLHNFGDLGAKFRFDIPSKYARIFSIQPSEGYVRPQEEIGVIVSFHPTQERVREFRNQRLQQARQRGKPGGDEKDITISVRDIRCVLDGHPPLTLEASGRCVQQVSEAESLEFRTEVRATDSKTIPIPNPTQGVWKVRPQVTTTEPAGTTYFSCPREIEVHPGGGQLEIKYTPLTMTEDGSTEDQHKVERLDKHRGSLFIGTPDGQAKSYSLEGTALAPKIEPRLDVKVPCKNQHTQRVRVPNWLHERQRFDVKVELIQPSPASDPLAAQGISIQGVGTMDLPAGLEREYKFNVYAYHAGDALVRVKFTNQITEEYMIVEVQFQFYAADSLAEIDMKSCCRQEVRHQIAIANPLNQVVNFTGKCENEDFRFDLKGDTLTIPARSEKTIDLLYRPLVEGKGQTTATLISQELGTYPYTVNWNATAAGLERTLILKAPLDGFVADGATPGQVESFKFIHYARAPETKYKAFIEAAPSQKGNFNDFSLKQAEVSAPAASDDGKEVSLDVRYQPSGLGECRALLVVQGDKGGEYKALLTGYAQPPQPQGPTVVQNGKAKNVTFRNPFATATMFQIQVDNPAFTVKYREPQKIEAQKEFPIEVTFKSDRTQGGRLIVSCPQSSTPWIFFLKGEL